MCVETFTLPYLTYPVLPHPHPTRENRGKITHLSYGHCGQSTLTEPNMVQTNHQHARKPTVPVMRKNSREARAM